MKSKYSLFYFVEIKTKPNRLLVGENQNELIFYNDYIYYIVCYLGIWDFFQNFENEAFFERKNLKPQRKK